MHGMAFKNKLFHTIYLTRQQTLCMIYWLLMLYSCPLNAIAESLPDTEAEKRIVSWEKMLHDKSGENELDILNKANAFFNKLTYIPDNPLQGEEDNWMTPYEFLSKGGGDCEDFAIAKFFTAIALGIPSEKLRITYVTVKNRNQAHMVLTYYRQPDAEPLVLDNLIHKILPASKRSDLVPVYSFGLEDVWLYKDTKRAKRHGNANSLSKWRALLKRFKTQHRLRNQR